MAPKKASSKPVVVDNSESETTVVPTKVKRGKKAEAVEPVVVAEPAAEEAVVARKRVRRAAEETEQPEAVAESEPNAESENPFEVLLRELEQLRVDMKTLAERVVGVRRLAKQLQKETAQQLRRSGRRKVSGGKTGGGNANLAIAVTEEPMLKFLSKYMPQYVGKKAENDGSMRLNDVKNTILKYVEAHDLMRPNEFGKGQRIDTDRADPEFINALGTFTRKDGQVVSRAHGFPLGKDQAGNDIYGMNKFSVTMITNSVRDIDLTNELRQRESATAAAE